jgi:hypothetical protein
MCGQKQFSRPVLPLFYEIFRKEKISIENVAQRRFDRRSWELRVDSNAVTAVQMMSIGDIRMVAAPWASARTRARLASLARFDNPLPVAAIEP